MRNHESRIVPKTARVASVSPIALTFWLLGRALATDASAQSAPTVPDGLDVQLFAEESLLSNPVAISVAADGAVYVAEALRKNTGVWGVTFSRWWAMEDYRHTTMADREAMYARWAHIVPESRLRAESEIVRRVWDSDGDGVADESTIFASGFDGRLDGNAAGVMAIGDKVYLTLIPNLWALEDLDGDARAETREILSSGYGVRVGVHGHDLHGLIQGPDGRLYFSVGDRGYDVTNQEGVRLHESHRGAVFRCFPDGSGLEVFHRGLRNPQELAFNEYGDLFTVDNNMSGGDECRVLHLLEGADSGWDATFQLSGHFREETDRLTHPKPTWFTEELWSTPRPDSPRWRHPAIGNLSRGPSGLAYYPGVGLGDAYLGAFFLADFVGSPANSEILNFWLQPVGASYTVSNTQRFAGSTLATDVAFGPDGALYISDWINGWVGLGEGRIWKVTSNSQDVAENQRERVDFEVASVETLARFMESKDQRERQRAQFELVERGESGRDALISVLKTSENSLARIHAVWGLGQWLMREASDPSAGEALEDATRDQDPQIRAQALKVARWGEASILESKVVASCLKDPHPRVRYQAWMTAAGMDDSVLDIGALKAIEGAAIEDPALRHASVTFLARRLSGGALVAFRFNEDERLREMAVLALRRKGSPRIAEFLGDPSDRVRFASIRALHDTRIEGGLASIARLSNGLLSGEDEIPTPIARRILNANFRLGTIEAAARLGRLAGVASTSLAWRIEALDSLLRWDSPSDFDRVTWALRPLDGERVLDIGPVIQDGVLAAFESLSSIKSTSRSESETEALEIAARLLAKYEIASPLAAESIALSADYPLKARLAFIQDYIDRETLTESMVLSLMADPNAEVKATVSVALADGGDVGAVESIHEWLGGENTALAQALLRRLVGREGAWVDSILETVLDRAVRDGVRPEIWLELNDVVAGRPRFEDKLSFFLRKLSGDGGFGVYSMALRGGDADRGATLFRTHPAQCARCHQIDGYGGVVGPDLSAIGSILSREELLSSLIQPSARIAPGYGLVSVTLQDGEVVSGLLLSESETGLRVRSGAGVEWDISQSDVSERSEAVSSMPPMGELAPLRDLRDLVAYLAARR